MNCLQRIPCIHRNQPMIKVAFDFDTDLLGLANPQKGGTALRHIQTPLGQSSSKTTEIYTQVSTQEIGKTKNPLDDFYKTERSTIHANSGCIVEQNKNITEINTP